MVMTNEEFLSKITNSAINDEFVQRLEGKFGCSLPDLLKRIISISGKQLFFGEEKRLMSFTEIENSTELLHVDFKKKNLIPIIDAYENDFICFNYKTSKWCFFNVNEGVGFSENSSLDELL